MPAPERADIEYEIFAVRCAANQARKAGENMLFADQHDAPMPIAVRLDLPLID